MEAGDLGPSISARVLWIKVKLLEMFMKMKGPLAARMGNPRFLRVGRIDLASFSAALFAGEMALVHDETGSATRLLPGGFQWWKGVRATHCRFG